MPSFPKREVTWLKPQSTLKVIILVLLASLIYSFPTVKNTTVNAATPTTLGVWNDVYGFNLTSTSLTTGATFTVKVNATNAGSLGGFDVDVNYYLGFAPVVLQATSASFSPGLFDGTGLPQGCSIITAFSDVFPGEVHYGAALSGSTNGGQPCSVSGTGTLFIINFKVTGIGATSIDIVLTTNQGKASSILYGPAPAAAILPYESSNAFFRNVPGVPPVPVFSYSPAAPLLGDTISFNGTQSYDPEASSLPNHGLETSPLVYDSSVNNKYDSGEPVIIGATPSIGATLKTDLHIKYVDLTNVDHWTQGDSVVYDSNTNSKYDYVDFVITGPSVAANTPLKTDPKLLFDPIHGIYIWDNGYIWDFGDGKSLVTGNFTSHQFLSSTISPVAGTFQVRLGVYDSDDHLPMRLVQLVTISLGETFDISVSAVLTKDTLNVGQAEGVNVTVSNRGNQNFSANLTVTYDYQATTLISSENLSLARGSSLTFNYTIQTGSLSPKVYTITCLAKLTNATSPDPTPNDDEESISFTLLGTVSASFLTIPVVAGIVAVVAAAIYGSIYFLRRRKAQIEE